MKKDPGAYPGLSFADYWAIEAANHSILTHFRRSAAHARIEMLKPAESTPAQAFGTAAHCLILEPERFPLEFARSIKVDRRTTVGKADWAAWLAANQGKTPIDPDDFAALVAMREAVMALETARGLLTAPGANEVTLVWLDDETGTLCKARTDMVRDFVGYTFIGDLKTADDASPSAFRRASANFDYHSQAAMYLDGMAALGDGAAARFVHLVIEKEAPFGVALYELDDDSLDAGRRAYRAHLAAYAEAQKSGAWPAYPDGIVPLTLPVWALKTEE